MRLLLFIALFAYLSLSCSDSYKLGHDDGQDAPTGAPTSYFQSFADTLREMNWVSDTARLNKVSLYGNLDAEHRFYFNSHPFYYSEFKETHLYRVVIDGKGDFSPSLEEKELWKKTVSVWKYFYKDKNAHSGMITDGVIEQWEFESEEIAAEAHESIKRIGQTLYFNTRPYYCVHKNHLFIFHTRAMAFSAPQRKIFERFKSSLP